MSEFSKILNTFHGQNYISNFRVGFCVGEKTVLWALNWILNRLKGWIYEYIQWSKKEWEKEAFDIWTSSSTYELHMVSSKFFLLFFVWKFLKILYFRPAQLQSAQLMMTALKHLIQLIEVLMMILVTMLLLDTNQMSLLVMVQMMAMVKQENVAKH